MRIGPAYGCRFAGTGGPPGSVPAEFSVPAVLEFLKDNLPDLVRFRSALAPIRYPMEKYGRRAVEDILVDHVITAFERGHAARCRDEHERTPRRNAGPYARELPRPSGRPYRGRGEFLRAVDLRDLVAQPDDFVTRADRLH